MKMAILMEPEVLMRPRVMVKPLPMRSSITTKISTLTTSNTRPGGPSHKSPKHQQVSVVTSQIAGLVNRGLPVSNETVIVYSFRMSIRLYRMFLAFKAHWFHSWFKHTSHALNFLKQSTFSSSWENHTVSQINPFILVES